MFSTSQTASRETRVVAPSIICNDVVITGLLKSDGDIQIDGRVEGDVRSASLVVGEKAEIRGALEAEIVTVRGHVHGSIRARKVILARTGHVEGDILCQTLDVEFGAFVQASFRHNADPLAPALPKADPSQDDAEPMADRRRAGSPMRGVGKPEMTETCKGEERRGEAA